MGREAVMRQWEQQREAFDADTPELSDIIDLGDRVVTRFIWRAEGSGPDRSSRSPPSPRCARARPSWLSSSRITQKPSKPLGHPPRIRDLRPHEGLHGG